MGCRHPVTALAIAPPAGALRLRKEGVLSRPPSTQAKPSRPALRCQARSSSRALQLVTAGQPRSTGRGSTADGMTATVTATGAHSSRQAATRLTLRSRRTKSDESGNTDGHARFSRPTAFFMTGDSSPKDRDCPSLPGESSLDLRLVREGAFQEQVSRSHRLERRRLVSPTSQSPVSSNGPSQHPRRRCHLAPQALQQKRPAAHPLENGPSISAQEATRSLCARWGQRRC